MGRKTKITALAIAALLIAISSHFYMQTPEAAPVVAPIAFSPNALPLTKTPISERWDAM